MNLVTILILLTWMERSHAEFYRQVKRTMEYLVANRAALGFAATTPAGKWLDEVLLPAYLAFDTRFKAWEDPATRTNPDILMLQKTETAFRVLYQQLYEMFKAAVYIDDDTLVKMGFPSRNTKPRGHSPVATTYPLSRVDTSLPAHVIFHFFSQLENEQKTRKGKPKGQQGAELRYVISDVPIVDYEDLVHSAFDTNSPLTLEFAGHERGKFVYFAFRWENTRGEKGPFSPIMSVMIP